MRLLGSSPQKNRAAWSRRAPLGRVPGVPPVTATEEDVAKAVGHPVRREVLKILLSEPASAKEIAARLGLSVPNASYHVTLLRDLGLLELVRETPRRGAIEKHYRAQPNIDPAAWVTIASSLDAITPRGQTVESAVFSLDRQGRDELDAVTRKYWEDLAEIENRSSARLANRGAGRAAVRSVSVIRGKGR